MKKFEIIDQVRAQVDRLEVLATLLNLTIGTFSDTGKNEDAKDAVVTAVKMQHLLRELTPTLSLLIGDEPDPPPEEPKTAVAPLPLEGAEIAAAAAPANRLTLVK